MPDKSDSSPEREAARGPGKVLFLSLGLGALWIFLAFNSPETTFHLGPPLVAAAVAMSHRSTGSGPLSNPAAAGAAVSGLTNALVATAVLAFNDKLEGGSLLPFGDATVEALVFAVGGAVVGFVIGIWGRGSAE
ncbi:MAG: hypothetical protein OER12_00675 [Acidimicrobiia bacterium]|nr:hypothetical protein [Acidimicrobiia bacterium]